MASLGAMIAIIVLSVGGLVLLVLGVMMMIGAVLPKRSVITSWPAQQEASFMGYDSRNAASQSKAWVIAIVSGVGVFFLISGIYLVVPPEKHDISKTMNMSNLTKKESAPRAAPAPKVEEKKPEAKPEEKKPEETKPEEKPAEAEKPAAAPKK